MTISSEIIHELHSTIELLKKKYDEAYEKGYYTGYAAGRRFERIQNQKLAEDDKKDDK